ncbi:MAG TPA: LamG domain-containing protein [Thermoanaerobaculia bacterium]|nr:LamG domain-containing protein [Thermoanaerobaculia bacterium]
MRRMIFGVLFVCLGLVLGVGSAQAAAPFGSWLVLSPGYPTSHGYVEVASHPALNPTSGFTFEAWVAISNSTTGEDCRTIAGKNYIQAWWIGQCNVSGQPTLRSYLRGGGSAKNGGIIPRGVWTHVAVTSDGVTRNHYINGVLAASFPETGPPTTSTSPLRIGSDVSWERTPTGAIDEVRLWSVARTAAQINSLRGVPLTTAQPGLVAVWSLDSTGEDVVGGFDGSVLGVFSFASHPAPPGGPWLTSSSVPGFQFKVRITSGANIITGVKENGCIAETLCVSGALPGRTEVFLRVIGPRPNGYLWPTIVRFTISQVEVWVEQTDTGLINYYLLDAVPADSDELNGLVDRLGYLP